MENDSDRTPGCKILKHGHGCGQTGADPQDGLQGWYISSLGVSDLGHHQDLLVLWLSCNQLLHAHQRLHTRTGKRPVAPIYSSCGVLHFAVECWRAEAHLGAHRW